MKVTHPITVDYEAIYCPKRGLEVLNSMPSLFAADFETAVRYTPQDYQAFQATIDDPSASRLDKIEASASLNATALGHPYHCVITHFSIAAAEDMGYTFVFDNAELGNVVLDFLTTTESTQVWHNYGYDGRFIRYYSGKDVKALEDSAILAKTLLNHCDASKASVSLKGLAGAWYGDWGISSDNFDLQSIHDPKVHLYAATDACATFKLWHYLQQFVGL